MAGATTSFFARVAACAGEVEFMTSAPQLVAPVRSSHDTSSALTYYTYLKFINSATDGTNKKF